MKYSQIAIKIERYMERFVRWKWDNWDMVGLGQRFIGTWNRIYWHWRLGRFGWGSCIYPHVVIYSPRMVKIGKRVNIVEFVHIWGAGGVEIGDNTMIASHVVITSQTHDKYAPIFRDSNILKPVKIGNNCWVGAGAVILPGTTIGDGSIIGAGAVVTKNVLPRCVAAGVPAKVIERLPRRYKMIC